MNARNAEPSLIGLSAWSIRWKVWVDDPAEPMPQIELADWAQSEFGIDTLELYNGFLESRQPDYLDRLRDAAQAAGCCLHGMAVDVPDGNMCAADAAERRIAVAQNMIYVAVAERLGLTYFRVNTGGTNPPEPGEIDRAIDSYRQLTDVAWDRGIKIALENHGGISYTPDAVVRVIEEVGPDRMGTLPDIGNFKDDPGAADKIAKMAPYALASHAKFVDFDAEGEATNLDMAQMAGAMQSAGFEGPWSIEIGDPAAKNPEEGIAAAKTLLERYVG